MSFFNELKRRNVVRVGVAYAVATWVLVQIGDVAAENFEAPAWVMKMFMTALIAGFPIVLFFSWAYEITPDGIKKESEIDHSQSITSETGKKLDYVVIALLVIAIGFIGYDRMMPEASPEPVAVEQASTTVAPASTEQVQTSDIEDNSIAVLPFVNMSADPEQEYFSDGISEELLNLLVRVDGLTVASRTSSFAYKGETTNIPEIAQDLKVANVLEGSVRKSGNRVRITAQLIDTRNDRHLWSDTYDRELDDIFAIQDEIANAIVSALRTELDLAIEDQFIEVTAATDNLDAYDLFLKGHNLFTRRQRLDESVELLERAVELDPEFARAWGDLAAVAWVAPGWDYAGRDYVSIAQKAANKALELDENQSMVWAVKSYLRHEEVSGRNYNDSLAYLDKALEIDSKNTTAWLWRGLAKSELGYHKEAIEDLSQCLRIDAGYLNCQFHLGNTLTYLGDYEGAVESQKTLFRNGFVGILAASVMVLLNMDQELAAYAMAHDLGSHPDFPLVEWLDALEYPERDHSASIAKAEAYLAIEKPIGMQEALMLAFGAYDRLENDIHFPQNWIWTREYQGFHESPGFKRLVENLNLEAYWREHGFPPQCRPIGDEDFVCE
ncbi:MAG: tetratricopeptide repeat protein [Gammaproteobacteria bacterium]